MIDIIKTALVAIDEYEMQYGKRPVLFINKQLYDHLIADISLRYDFRIRYNDMTLCGYPTKLVLDDSNEMHFWIGEQKPIYA